MSMLLEIKKDLETLISNLEKKAAKCPNTKKALETYRKHLDGVNNIL